MEEGMEEEETPPTTGESLVTASTATRAESRLAVPFLPRGLTVTEKGRGRGESVDERKIVGGEGEGEIRRASRASMSFVRPSVVQSTSGRSSPGSRKLGLKEMLLSEAPAVAAGPSSAKLKSMLGEGVEFGAKREGVVDSTSREVEDEVIMNGNGNGRSTPDGLRSNPVSPANPNPKQMMGLEHRPSRRVTFPGKPVDVREEDRGLRQSIVSTPYPLGYEYEMSGGGSRGEEGTTVRSGGEGEEEDEEEGRKDVLTLVIYGPNNARVPKIKEVVIPKPKKTRLVDDHGDEKKSSAVTATLKKNYDDEQLFKLIRKEYGKMRGWTRGVFSARSVKNIGILHYRFVAELRYRDEQVAQGKTFGAKNDDLFGDGLLALFQDPKLGRRSHRWTDWISKLPGNSESERRDRRKIAIEFIQGWCLASIALAVMTILMLSLAATLLWIFLGVGSLSRSPHGYRGAGDRVETGVALGVLVLLFGWTGVGGWVLLSWLGN